MSSTSDTSASPDRHEWPEATSPPGFADAESGPSRGTSRKRKGREDRDCQTLNTKSKRLKPAYNEEYHRLLDRHISDVMNHSRTDESRGLTLSRVSGSHWTAEEKTTLFSTVARTGRFDTPGIATHVQTKAETEVREYLRLLRIASAKHDLYASKRRSLFKLSTIEPALEIGETCQAALEMAADAIEERECRHLERAEMGKHPRTWLVTSNLAKWIEKSLQAGNEASRLIVNEIPVAILLNAQALLSLSKHIFMNSSDLAGNWRTFAEPRRSSPCMLHSSLSDLHSLTVYQTKRLVQRSLLLANLRIKAGGLGRKVRRADVLAAIRMTGMAPNTWNFWPGVARKCRLQVHEYVKQKKVGGKHYTLDEVEACLEQRNIKRGKSGSQTGRSTSIATSREDGSDASGSEAFVADLEDDGASSDGLESLSSPSVDTKNHSPESPLRDTVSSERSGSDFDSDASAEAYCEELDVSASRAEEQRLKGLLSKARTADTWDQVEDPLIEPRSATRRRRDLEDWTDWVDHVSEWELSARPSIDIGID